MATITDKLKKYELAAFAESKIKEKAEYSLLAMQEFYKSIYKSAGRDINEDYMLNKAFQEASRGLEDGHITNEGIFGAIQEYTKHYNKAFLDSTVSEFLDYAKDKGYDVPDKVAPVLESCKSRKLREIYDEKEDKDEAVRKAAKKLWNAISLIRDYVMDASILPEIIKNRTDSGLEALLGTREE